MTLAYLPRLHCVASLNSRVWKSNIMQSGLSGPPHRPKWHFCPFEACLAWRKMQEVGGGRGGSIRAKLM